MALNKLIIAMLIVGFAGIFLPTETKSETYITTYVTKVQEERKSTRWTLTEWLRIKERMRMMDLWLALFGNKEEAKTFAPEFKFKYGLASYVPELDSSNLSSEQSINSNFGEIQIWLTNLVSSQLGIRTLNIDLGIELSSHASSLSDPASSGLGLATSNLLRGANDNESIHSYSANLRLFGKNIQDSSLIFKYGNYSWKKPLSVQETVEANQLIYDDPIDYRGKFVAGELQLYLFDWLGAETNYTSYKRSASNDTIFKSGQLWNYGAFIEISILRLFGGYHQIGQDYQMSVDSNVQTHQGKGTYYGLQLSI